MSVEGQLQEVIVKLEEHEKRHDREQQTYERQRESCDKRFEEIFARLNGVSEYKGRVNGLSKHEDRQDETIDDLKKRMDRWFVGIIVSTAVLYFIDLVFR